jgi:hypothetical protein
MTYLGYYISKGDSVFLEGVNVMGSYPPFKYLWRPNSGLSDSTSTSFWAKPDSNIFYYVTVTDSAGCTYCASGFHYVRVSGVGLDEMNAGSPVRVYPNPSKGIVNFESPYQHGEDLLVEFFDSKGIRVKTLETKGGTFQVDTDALPGGLLLYKISKNGKVVNSGKLLLD